MDFIKNLKKDAYRHSLIKTVKTNLHLLETELLETIKSHIEEKKKITKLPFFN